MNPLQSRLAALRRRLRLVVTFRGACWLLTVFLVTACVAGWLDWHLHLPSLVRAGVLVGALATCGYVAYRHLFQPLVERADDLALALRIEARFPFLNDSLASTVQFLEQSKREDLETADTHGSPSLRKEAVRRTLRQMQGCDFNCVVDSRGVGSAGLLGFVAAAFAAVMIAWDPLLAWTALERLAHPYGLTDWPRQTRLEISAEERIARGDPFEIHGRLSGIIPEHASVAFEGLSPARQTISVRRDKDAAGSLALRLERVEHSFRFQVSANDAASAWHSVSVEPPPMLVPLDGRPSPQVRLTFPPYTDLPSHDLPDGSGNVEAVLGTTVSLRAAADRPLARAWLEYRPESPQVGPASLLSVLSALDFTQLATLSAAGLSISGPQPVRLSADGKLLAVSFQPRVRGMYALRFEDRTGLCNTRLFDLQLLTDPSPVVNLDRPSRGHDSLFVLKDADIVVQTTVEDPIFAVRSVALAYRCKNSAGDPEPLQLLTLYHHQQQSNALSSMLTAFSASPLPTPGLPLHLRPQRMQVQHTVSLTHIRHASGRELQEGDVVTLQASADDFDDVTPNKPPGQSHEIDIHIISRAALEAQLNREQALVQEELLRLRKEQQEALQRVINAEQRWRNTGKLRSQDIDQLLQAEQLQQQIRARIGTRQEGLRADVERILNTLQNNRLPRGGANDRMETTARELDRLTREELDQIEPRLTNARKENETAADTKPPPKDQKGTLGEAREHQEEVENTLNELLKILEPWGSLSAVQGEARSILQEQRKLNEEIKSLEKQGMSGLRPDSNQLSPDQKAALGKGAELQRKLEERADQLLGKMQRTGTERQGKDPALAEALKEAVNRGEKGALKDNLKNAGQNIRNNNLGKADQDQQAAAKTLGDMVQALEERREQELDRLRKKLQEAQEKLADLTQRQDELRKKTRAAQQMTDPEKREQALKQLARQQEQLRKEAQEMVRELNRLRADQAGQALNGASGNMEQAGQQLTRGQNPEESQDESLDRLNDAQRRMQQIQDRVEEELAREKLAKVEDQIKQLRSRQEAALAETARIQVRVQERNGWDRITLTNLRDHTDAQKALAQETEALAKGKLAPAKVFARTLEQSAAAMQQAAEHMERQRERVQDDAIASGVDPSIAQVQQKAMRRLDQLLEALKTDRSLAVGAPQAGDGGEKGGGESQGGRPPGDSIGQLAQLKVLRTLQLEVNERTADFNKKHPDASALTPDQQRELQSLQKEQQDIADLLDELTTPAGTEGGKQ